MEIRIVPPSPAYARMRRWPRFSVELPVRIYGDVPQTVRDGRGTNLNAGGMAVHATVDLRVGDQIAIEFAPPGVERAVTARCFIRNRSAETYGVEFIAENDTDYRTIGEIEYGLNKLAANLH